MVSILFSGILLFLSEKPAQWSFDDHAIYLSVVEVTHAARANTASIKVKVFSDDISDAVSNMHGERVDLTEAINLSQVSAKVEAYFVQHLELSFDGEPATLKLSQSEPMSDAIWFYFEANCPSQWREVSVKANYLMELFPTQSNVLSVVQGDEKRFANLVRSKPTQTLKF